MKRILALILALTFIFSLAACKSDEQPLQSSISELPQTQVVTNNETNDVTDLPDVSFEEVKNLDDFADKLEKSGHGAVLKQHKDGAVTVELKQPTAPKKDGDKKEEKPAVPTIDKVAKPEPEVEPAPTPEPEVQPEPAPAPKPVVKPSNKTHTYTKNQKHTALPLNERYLYSILTAEQKTWYNKIDKAIKNLEAKVDLGKVDIIKDRKYYIYYIYMFDNPEHFYLGNTMTILNHSDGVAISFCYSDGKNYCSYGHTPSTITPELKQSILAKKATFDSKVEQIVSTIPANAPDVEKERLIYDYILANSHYNLGARWNGICEPNWNAYGILVNGYGVCESYSEAFQTLCQRVGINCTGVVGTAGGGHKWNAIKLDGEWYACDITFDDPIGGEQGAAYHYYFNLTTKQMEEYSHSTQNSEYPGPVCTGTKYNYRTYYGD